MSPNEADFTRLLAAWRAGDQNALEEVTDLAYRELRKIAVARLRGEGSHPSLQPTELVNEMFLRLLSADVPWRDRSHFYSLAARTMRRVLVDQARARKRQKRGEDPLKITLEDWHGGGSGSSTAGIVDVLAIDQALDALQNLDEGQAKVVELYFFAGLTFEEISKVTERSRSAVHRLVRSGQAWLVRQLRERPQGATT
ncbi:MAG: sigma-70 family RNA polymerase sigma factor [Deltaproteobacteria bacterium]|nr:sigma-70 family RNA polymerase sigma factor [Deltaproteobacteria bacterium]